jgi:hypothetical protein
MALVVRSGVCTGDGPCVTSPIGPGPNWVTKTTPIEGLGPYARAIAHALIRNGHSKQEAIQITIGVLKRWAKGQGTAKGQKVTPATVARAKEALKHWDALKAEADSSHRSAEPSAPVVVPLQHGPIGAPPPPAPPPVIEEANDTLDANFAYRLGMAHRRNGRPPLSAQEFALMHPRQVQEYAIYLSGYNATSDQRAAVAEWGAQGPPGPAVSGTVTGASDLLPAGPARLKTQAIEEAQMTPHAFSGRDLTCCSKCHLPLTASVHRRPHQVRADEVPRGALQRFVDGEKATHIADLAAIEEPLTAALHDYFGRQRHATISRLVGKRGKTMLKRAAQSAGSTQPTPVAPTSPVVLPPTVTGAMPVVSPSLNLAAIFDTTFWRAKLAELLMAHYQRVKSAAVGRVRAQIAVSPQAHRDSLENLDAVLRLRAQTSAMQVTTTTRKQVFGALQEGMAHGTGIAGLATRVNKVFDNAQRVRAKMIAQTEAVGSLNQAVQEYSAKLPRSVAAKKVWLSHHTARTRPAHRAADGQVAAVTSPYLVGGYRMMFPGDPTAPPDLVINCRCGQSILPPALSVSSLAQAALAFVPPTTQAHLNDLIAAQQAQAEGLKVPAMDIGA